MSFLDYGCMHGSLLSPTCIDNYFFLCIIQIIEPHHDPTTNASNANRTKNRSNNFPACMKTQSMYLLILYISFAMIDDHSRVILAEPSMESDYINANYIKVHYFYSVNYRK